MTPLSTYRIQLNRTFRFNDAEAIVDYLYALGITDLYTSPVFTARTGSMHGYDVTDPTQLNPELGGAEGFEALSHALNARGMGLVMDIVPNHMSASPENHWWLSVLENGPSSEFAQYFDIVWQQGVGETPVQSKVLLPILGGHYGTVLEQQELQVVLTEEGFFVSYWETQLPLDPKTYRIILEQRYGQLKDLLGTYHPAFRAYESLIELTEQLPARTDTEPDDIAKRRRETGRLKADLWRLYSDFEEIREFVDENIRLINGEKGFSASFDLLDRLLSEQAYRLAFWRVANQEINYRRFFDVADLVSMRIEDDEVFAVRHAPLDDLIAQGQVTGLRIDHIDGLHDPQGYLERLQSFVQPQATLSAERRDPFYVVVEKILAEGEHLRDEWITAGTTGYDFLNLVNGLLVDTRDVGRLDALYRRFTGVDDDFATIVFQQKRRVMADLFSGDVRSLVARLDRLSMYDRHGRDLTQRELGQALSEVTARFHVYRTYIRSADVDDADREQIDRAIEDAIAARTDLTRACRFLRRVLLMQFPALLPEHQQAEWLAVVMRWQQFTGPIMAKGHEDTALYIYNRLVSLNDVGGEPGEVGVSISEFHETNRERGEHWPHTMNATSTHDTKRSEDVRTRINVISEIVGEWEEHVYRWRDINARCRQEHQDDYVPDGNLEYFIYQTLVGAWPLSHEDEPSFYERVRAYLLKAIREAKVHTSWIQPNEAYEQAADRFLAAILDPANETFRHDFVGFQSKVAWFGALNSLSQALLKITSPGVPDIYQGTELWDFSLVDPDNRRPVDYAARRLILAELERDPSNPGQYLADWRDGRVKMLLTSRSLAVRRDRRDLFTHGSYVALNVRGSRSGHVVAFAREFDQSWAVVIAPRHFARLARDVGFDVEAAPVGVSVWGDTIVDLPEGAPSELRNVFDGQLHTGRVIRLAEVYAQFPYALLVST